jgi:hypothetical protein
LLVSVGFVSLAIAGFVFAVKALAILPAPLRLWYQLEKGPAGKVEMLPEKLPGSQYAAGD